MPIVLAAVRNLTIAGASKGDVSYGDIHITVATLASSAVSFTGPSAAANNETIGLTLAGLSLSTGNTNFEVSKKIGPFGHIHCSGHFSAAIKNTDVAVFLKVINANGLPQVVASTSIDFGSVDVSHKMEHESCKIAEKIIEVFIGNINKKIESEIKSKVPAVVQSALNTQVNKLLAGLGLVVDVTPDATANFSLSGTPVITDTRLTLGFVAKFEPKVWPAGGVPPTPIASPLPQPATGKDLALAFSSSVLDSASAVYTALGSFALNESIPANVSATLRLVLPQLRKAFPTQPLSVEIAACPRLPPRVIFGKAGAQIAAENASLVLSAVMPNGSLAPALRLSLNGSINASVALGDGAANISISLVAGEYRTKRHYHI